MSSDAWLRERRCTTAAGDKETTAKPDIYAPLLEMQKDAIEQGIQTLKQQALELVMGGDDDDDL